MKNNELKAAAEALRPNVNAPELSEKAYRQACDDILALIDQLDEPVTLHQQITFTCERTGKRWEFDGLAQLVEAFLKQQEQAASKENLLHCKVQEVEVNKPVDAQGVDEEIVYGKNVTSL